MNTRAGMNTATSTTTATIIITITATARDITTAKGMGTSLACLAL